MKFTSQYIENKDYTGHNSEIISAVQFFNVSNLLQLVAPSWLAPRGKFGVFDILESLKITYLNIK